MRILHISKYYYPFIGGVENICRDLVENMPQHQMAVICFNSGKQDIIEDVNGVRVYRVGSKLNISRQALSYSYFPLLKRAIKEFNPEMIHFHWANPFPAAVLLTMIPKNVKLVVHWHMDIIKQKRIYPFIKPIETALLKRANFVVVTSPQYRDGSKPLQRFKDKVQVVPNAVDTSLFVLNDNDQKRIDEIKRLYDYRPIVFFVGRHIQYKGLPYLLEAEKYVKSDCVFAIAGHGPLTDMLKSKCNSNRVFFLGKVSDNDLKCYQYAASVFAFPSISKNEAFGVALAEAMYCYTPAVTFNIPGSGVNWVNVNGVTGIEVPNGDSKAFAHGIDEILGDQALSEKYAIAGHNRVAENFTIPNMVDRLEKLYKEL